MLARTTNKLIVSPTFYEHVICYPVTFINKWVRGAAVSAPGSLEVLAAAVFSSVLNPHHGHGAAGRFPWEAKKGLQERGNAGGHFPFLVTH